MNIGYLVEEIKLQSLASSSNLSNVSCNEMDGENDEDGKKMN